MISKMEVVVMIFKNGDRIKVNSNFNERVKKEFQKDTYGTVVRRIDFSKLKRPKNIEFIFKLKGLRKVVSKFITEDDLYEVLLDDINGLEYKTEKLRKRLVPSCLMILE